MKGEAGRLTGKDLAAIAGPVTCTPLRERTVSPRATGIDGRMSCAIVKEVTGSDKRFKAGFSCLFSLPAKPKPLALSFPSTAG